MPSLPPSQVGAKGVKDSHRNSLRELLVAHGHVVVKVNGARDPSEIEAAARELCGDDAVALRTKGASVLFAPRGDDDDDDDDGTDAV